MPQQQYRQVTVQPPPSRTPQNTGNMQIMYDGNGNPVYVQLMYDRTGKPVYVQMMPKIVGRDSSGKPVYAMVPVAQISPSQQTQSQQMMQSQQMQSQQMQSQQMQSQQMQSQQMMQPQQMQSQQMMQPQQMQPQRKNPSFLDTVSQTSSRENAQFIPQNSVKPPPVPVMPRPGEQPEQPAGPSVPDRPAVKAASLASAMYTASQSQQNPTGTGSFFARMQQQKQIQSGYTQPVSAEELLREEARTAFVQQPPAQNKADSPDEDAVLNRIFEAKQKEYQMNTGRGNSTFSVDVPADEVRSVSEKNLYQTPEKPVSRPAPAKPARNPQPEPAPEPPSEPKTQKSEGLKFFRPKKPKEKPKHKTIIVDPDEIFGDSKKHKVEMLGVSIEGDDKAVDDKIKEMKDGGKKSRRSMIAADVSLESMVDDPLSGDAARKALTEEVVQQAYDSIESAEIAKALEQLNQGIFPKSTKD